jgi:copper homeostasis protein
MARSELLCTDLASVELALDLGADRIELCAALEVGGVTPGPGLLRRALQARDRAAAAGRETEVVVLTRPRRGDFALDAGDFGALLADVVAAREAGADGVALGVLTQQGEVDVSRTAELMAAAGAMRVTFHRAFDQLRDRAAGVEALLGLGVHRLLTSGGASSAWEGRVELRALVEGLGGRIEVVAAGGVSGDSAARVLEATGVPAIHGSCSAPVGSPPTGAAAVALGKPGAAPEELRLTLDAESAGRFVRAATGTSS